MAARNVKSVTVPDEIALYSLRIERSKLERFAEVAAAEHRNMRQKLTRMIEREIARFDEESAA